MLIVIPAVGEVYEKYARSLATSLRAWGWEANIFIPTTKLQVPPDTHPKQVKTGFADYLPMGCDDTPVLLLDADMLAIGAPPDFGKHDIVTTSIGNGRYDSCSLYFRNASLARKISKEWNAQWVAEGMPQSDVPSLNAVLKHRVVHTHANNRPREYATPGLLHYLTAKLIKS